MSTNTITSYHQVTRDELASLSPDTGARIAVTTDDQSYEMYVSDGTKWIKLGNTRTEGIPYTLTDYNNQPGPTVSHTPEYHFDSAPGVASTHIFSDLQGTSVNPGDRICEWKSLTGGHSLKQLDVSRQPHWNHSSIDTVHGALMHDIGTGMCTTEENNKQLTGDTVTFVVFKPSADNISDLVRDINHATARAPIGVTWYVELVGSNLYLSSDGNYSDIKLFFLNSEQHTYTYFTQTYSSYVTQPKNGSEVMVDGVGRLANWNENFLNKRQLAVLITSNPKHERRGYEECTFGNFNHSAYNVYYQPNNKTSIMRGVPSKTSLDFKYDGFSIGTKYGNRNPHCLLNETIVFNNMLSYNDINAIAAHLALKWDIPNVFNFQRDVNTINPESHYLT